MPDQSIILISPGPLFATYSMFVVFLTENKTTEQKAVIYSRMSAGSCRRAHSPSVTDCGLQTHTVLINMQICITSLAIQIALPCNVPQNCSTSNIAFDLHSPPGHPIMSTFIQTIRHLLNNLLSLNSSSSLLPSKPAWLLWDGLCPPFTAFSWHPTLASFPWHAGRRADACLSTQHIISMRCISTVMNASLPLGSALVPPHAPVCGSSDCWVWSAREHSARPRWQGAQWSIKWQNLWCVVIQHIRSGRAGIAPDLPSASFTCAFPFCQFAHNVCASHPHLRVRSGWHVFLPPLAIRVFQRARWQFAQSTLWHMHTNHEVP